MSRITRKHVEAQTEIVNRMLGIPEDAPHYTPGAVRLYLAYGGCEVVRIVNDGGGHSSLSQHGCGPLREASAFLSGMIAALRLGPVDS